MADYIKLIGESEDRELVGGKGSSLSIMKNLGLPVPPGFTITTEAWRDVASDKTKFNALWKMIAEQMEATFPNFGEGELVSVRSGAASSMPGMMDTILNVGIKTDDHPMLRLNFWKSFCLAVGVKREAIQDKIDERLIKRGSFFVDSLGPSDIGSLISELAALAKEQGSVPTTKHTLLKRSIQIVFDSWNSERAVAYREQFGISHDLGTACTIQLMVSGLNGGAGVYLTRNPQTGDPEPYIDWAEKTQGDSVVDGSCLPSSAAQLKARFPQQYDELISIGRKLEGVYRDAVDIEFTIDNSKLYILQCRSMKRSPSARPRIALDLVLDGIGDRQSILSYSHPALVSTRAIATTSAKPFCSATPIVPQLVKGKITLKDSPEPGMIMVRKNTTTDDLPHMLKAQAIVTIVGGPTCHAALVARESGIPAYVGAQGCFIEYGKLKNDSAILKEGDAITILPDGKIFAGEIETSEQSEVDPNYARLQNLKKLLEAV